MENEILGKIPAASPTLARTDTNGAADTPAARPATTKRAEKGALGIRTSFDINEFSWLFLSPSTRNKPDTHYWISTGLPSLPIVLLRLSEAYVISFLLYVRPRDTMYNIHCRRTMDESWGRRFRSLVGGWLVGWSFFLFLFSIIIPVQRSSLVMIRLGRGLFAFERDPRFFFD